MSHEKKALVREKVRFFVLFPLLWPLLACTAAPPKPAPESAQKQETDATLSPGKKSNPGPLSAPPGSVVSFDQELKHISRIRKLESKGSLIGLEVEKQDLLAHVQQAVELETPPHALEGVEAMLVGLGLVPPAFDYKQTMLTMLGERLAGMYQPRLKAMLVRKGLTGQIRDITLLHELVHALQDQHFDVMEVIEWNPDDTDRSSALSCLAEGDATSAMWDGILPAPTTALDLPEGQLRDAMRAEPTDGVPKVLSRSLLAPYIDGIAFVHALRRRGGWEEVNRVWAAPPQTTEQILHLNKYDQNEPAVVVPIPEPPDKSFRLMLSDTWGEQNLRITLEEWMPEKEAARAAAGWGGDRIAVRGQSSQVVVTWDLVMDSAAEARELFTLLRTHLVESEPGGESKPGAGDDFFCGKPDTATGISLGVFQYDTNVTLQSAALNRKTGAEGGCTQVMGWKMTPRARP